MGVVGDIILHQGRRSNMEDAAFLSAFEKVLPGWVLAGVFDGHDGTWIPQLCAKQYREIFFRYLVQLGATTVGSLWRTFTMLDARVCAEAESDPSLIVGGATGGVILVTNTEIVFGHVGDIKAYLIRSHGTLDLFHDHTVENPIERQRIIRYGGVVQSGRVWLPLGTLGIQMTRAIGDPEFKCVGISALPSIIRVQRSPDDRWLLLMSDGVWRQWGEVLPQEIPTLASCTTIEEVRVRLPRFLADGTADDNVSVVIIDCRYSL